MALPIGLLLLACACEQRDQVSRKMEIKTEAKLEEILEGSRRERNSKLRLKTVDKGGEAVPWGLLTFEWENGAKITFQTDESGAIDMGCEWEGDHGVVFVRPEVQKGIYMRWELK